MPVLNRRARQISAIKSLFAPALLALGLANCSIGSYPAGTLYKITAQPLSLHNPGLKTCVFDAHYSINHFPMYHPPFGHYTTRDEEEVTLSQFQLMHTIIAYSRSHWELAVFDENIINSFYNKSYLNSLASDSSFSGKFTRFGNEYSVKVWLNQANQLFRGGIPQYYEYLNRLQKKLLFEAGGSFILYLLGQIPELRKVITPEEFDVVMANTVGPNGLFQITPQNKPYVYEYRERALAREVLDWTRANHGRPIKALIAYGASHDFSDEFAGHPFQSGHHFCLEWRAYLNRQNRSVLP